MKILFLSHRLPFPANKGEKIRTFNQMRLLMEEGHKVTVFAPIGGDSDLQFGQALTDQYGIQVELFGVAGKFFRYLRGVLKGQSLSEANFYSAALSRRLSEHIGQFDAVVCSSSAMGGYLLKGSLQREKSKLILLMDFMDLDSEKWSQYENASSWPMSWVYRRESEKVLRLELAAQRAFDACYFIAEPEVEFFRKKTQSVAGENVKVLGNGLDPLEFYPAKWKQSKGKATLLFTGVMDYRPNVDAVLWFVESCWEKLREQNPGIEFIIAGMNPSTEIERLKKMAGITVTGFVEDILPYYHRADIFVAPFRLARGVQNKVLQAFACGLPVVASPLGAEGINCKHMEHICVARTAQEYIDAIRTLLAEKAVADSIGSNALQLIQREFSWRKKLEPMLHDLNQFDA